MEKDIKADQVILGLALNYLARKTKSQSIEKICETYITECMSLEEIFDVYHSNKFANLIENDSRKRNIEKNKTINDPFDTNHELQVTDVSQNHKAQSKRTNSKVVKENCKFNNETLDKLSNICEGYGDLYHKLDLQHTNSDIAKMVKYILDMNIKVHNISLMFSDVTAIRSKTFYQKVKEIDPNYHWGRYTAEEDQIIWKNWEKLCQLCKIEDYQKILEQMHKESTFKTIIQKRQRNVVGCYLGHGLKRARHGSDVFERSKIIMYQGLEIRRKYSSQEDQVILDQVAITGDSDDTWNILKLKLNRPYGYNIRNRYLVIIKSGFYKTGNWTLEEDTVLLQSLFEGKLCKIDTIKSVRFLSMRNIEDLKRSKKSIHARYHCILEPVLLSYHYGLLNHNWKYNFVVHIINKNYKALKEVMWEELLEMFPGQSRLSLSYYLTSIRNDKLDFRSALQDHLIKIKNSQDYTERQKEYHQKIVEIYLKCTVPVKQK